MDVEERVVTLRALLTEYNYQYYVQHTPVVTDGEYDALYQELQELESNHPELVSPDSPTQRVGSDLEQGFEKVAHIRSVLSLAKALGGEDLAAWQIRNRKLEPEASFTYTVEPKFDGLTIVLWYQDGLLTQAATRGDGEIGDDVTGNARTIQSIPLRIPVVGSAPPPPVLVVRGEVLFTKEAFIALNRARVTAGEPEYVTARNTASGSLKQKDTRLTAKRNLSAYVYDILHVEGALPASHYDRLQWLNEVGFMTPPDIACVDGLDGVLDHIAWWKAQRDDLPFEIDGVVVKVDDTDLEHRLGTVGKHPRGAIACKFPAEEATTKLIAVKPQVGRTGRLTPTAHLEPVLVDDVTVSRASLHNYEQVAQLDIRIGDEVILKRSGDVIPYIVGPVTSMRTGEEHVVSPPETCPFCDTAVLSHEDFVDLFCPNTKCPERVFQNACFFASKAGLDIDGLGPKILQQLIEAGLVRDEADLFTLTAEQLLSLDRFAERKTTELLKSIDAARTRPLKKILTALGIPGVGGAVANILLEAFSSLEMLVQMAQAIRALEEDIATLLPYGEPPLSVALRHAHLKDPEAGITRTLNAMLEDSQDLEIVLARFRDILNIIAPLHALDGIGTTLIQQVLDWFAQPENIDLLKKLKAAGLKLEHTKAKDASQILQGFTFVITGTLPTLSRSQARTLIESHGGKVTSSVSKRTSYLVAGEKAGSKLTKAQNLQVPILDEAALHQLMGHGTE